MARWRGLRCSGSTDSDEGRGVRPRLLTGPQLQTGAAGFHIFECRLRRLTSTPDLADWPERSVGLAPGESEVPTLRLSTELSGLRLRGPAPGNNSETPFPASSRR